MKTLLVDNRDLHFTIDTYGMFNGDSVTDGELDYYLNEYGIEDIEFDYDHKGIVKALAEESVNLLHNEFVTHGDIVKAIDLTDTKSPDFYNYTTDSYTANWQVDEVKLKQYCLDAAEAYEAFVKENWEYEFTKAIEESDEDTQLVIALDFYTSNEYDHEDYEMAMFEIETEAYVENMSPTKEFQKAINKLEEAK